MLPPYSYLKPCVPRASMHLSLACGLHFLRILDVAGRGDEQQGVVARLLRRESESK